MSQRQAMRWDPGRAEMLDAPERERDMPAEQVADLLALTGSETVIDYGAGTGRLALAVAAKLGPEGSVIAIEDSSQMFQLLSGRLADTARAEPLLIDGDQVPLPDRHADRILAVDVLYHVRPGTLREMRRLLDPDGLLLMIDWERGHPREDGPPEGVLLTAGEAIQELAVAGLSAHKVDAPFSDRYTLLATTTPLLEG
jgi:ubiquinone/menaquinone biosynthesis C-methylase UbiE